MTWGSRSILACEGLKLRVDGLKGLGVGLRDFRVLSLWFNFSSVSWVVGCVL